MQPSLSPADNDPHDMLEIAPDVVLVARAEEELSRLARETKNRAGTKLGQPKSPPPLVSEPGASPTSPSQSPASRISAVVAALEVPAVDTSFRAAATSNGPSMAKRVARGLAGLVLAICIGAAAVAWRASGEMIKQAISDFAPQFAMKSPSPADASPPDAQDAPQPPAEQQAAAPAPAAAQDNATPAATAAPAAATASAAPVATAPDQTQLIQSMSRDLASLGQEVALLKASVAELKASNEQMSHELAKASEQNQKKASTLAARAAVSPARKPATSLRPTQASAAPPPSYPPAQTSPPYPPSQVSAPYPSSSGAYPPPVAAPYPPQTAYTPPPQAPSQSDDPDIPRPPMPVR